MQSNLSLEADVEARQLALGPALPSSVCTQWGNLDEPAKLKRATCAAHHMLTLFNNILNSNCDGMTSGIYVKDCSTL